VRGGARELEIDGERSFGGLSALERLAGSRYDAYSAEAERLDGDLWEIRIAPL